MNTRWLFPGLGGAALLLMSTGCVDPEGSFNDFSERKQRTSGSGGTGGEADSGPCNIPSAGQADGPVMLVVSTTLDASKPIVFSGSITTTEPPREVHFTLQPLDAMDRKQPVGSAIVQTYPVTDDGALIAALARSTIDGRANAIIYNSAIDSQVTLNGRVCKLAQPWSSGPVSADNYYCGTLTGHVFTPIDSDIDGTFTLIRLANASTFPEPPPIDCAGTPASALAP